MPRRADTTCKTALSGPILGALAGLLVGACSTDPYQIETTTDPPWELLDETALPVLDPPLSDRAHRVSLCYGAAVNEEAEVLARAEEICDGGRLIVEGENDFWNGCSVLQPTRVTYICDPPAEAAAEN